MPARPGPARQAHCRYCHLRGRENDDPIPHGPALSSANLAPLRRGFLLHELLRLRRPYPKREIAMAKSEKICPECNGDGVVDQGTDDERRCPTCNGCGVVPDDGQDSEEVWKSKNYLAIVRLARQRLAWPRAFLGSRIILRAITAATARDPTFSSASGGAFSFGGGRPACPAPRQMTRWVCRSPQGICQANLRPRFCGAFFSASQRLRIGPLRLGPWDSPVR